MNKLFLLVFDTTSYPRQKLLDFLKVRPEIADFHASVPASLVILVSDLAINALREFLNKEGGLNYFLLVQTSPDRAGKELDGYLPKATWEFIQSNPRLNLPPATVPSQPTPTPESVPS